MTSNATPSQKTLTGKVVSVSMDKTIGVEVDRFVKHPKIHKYYTVSKKYLVHDETNSSKIGEKVTIQACRPLSKRKSFTIVSQ
jgi:small subunit ribosomal protein S17